MKFAVTLMLLLLLAVAAFQVEAKVCNIGPCAFCTVENGVVSTSKVDCFNKCTSFSRTTVGKTCRRACYDTSVAGVANCFISSRPDSPRPNCGDCKDCAVVYVEKASSKSVCRKQCKSHIHCKSEFCYDDVDCFSFIKVRKAHCTNKCNNCKKVAPTKVSSYTKCNDACNQRNKRKMAGGKCIQSCFHQKGNKCYLYIKRT